MINLTDDEIVKFLDKNKNRKLKLISFENYKLNFELDKFYLQINPCHDYSINFTNMQLKKILEGVVVEDIYIYYCSTK